MLFIHENLVRARQSLGAIEAYNLMHEYEYWKFNEADKIGLQQPRSDRFE